jgi:hypothetical protein
MKYQLYKQVALAIDLPNKGFRKGDVATIVEHHAVKSGEDGYTLEVFNALGETINVITVSESAIQPLSSNEILHVRSLVHV